MKKTQQGFIIPAIAILIIIAGSGYVYFKNNKSNQIKNENKSSSSDISNNEISTSTNNIKEEEIPINNKINTDDTKVVQAPKSAPKVAVTKPAEIEKVPEQIVDTIEPKILNAQIQAMLGSFEISALMFKQKNGSYLNVCDTLKDVLTPIAMLNISRGNEMREMYKQESGIEIIAPSVEIYKIDEAVCKSNTDSYVITMPIPNNDGSQNTVCTSNRVNSSNPVVIGSANFEDYTCKEK